MSNWKRTTAESLSQETIEAYRSQGFVRIPGVILKEEAAEFYQAAYAKAQQAENPAYKVFTQLVNLWLEDETIKRLTLHPNVAAVAEKLAGVPLRLWHDQTLVKNPHNQTPTQFHQDQPYWPHENSLHPISAWIALCDVPVERGCMSFIPGSHRRTDLEVQNLQDAKSLFNICPELTWEPRVTLPLRAGDCTFHHGRCAHMATPNDTDEPRVAHVVLFMDAATRYSGTPENHPAVEASVQKGQPLEGARFPLARDIVGGALKAAA